MATGAKSVLWILEHPKLMRRQKNFLIQEPFNKSEVFQNLDWYKSGNDFSVLCVLLEYRGPF